MKKVKLIKAPRWCATMDQVIALQLLAEDRNKSFAECLREALDDYVKIKSDTIKKDK